MRILLFGSYDDRQIERVQVLLEGLAAHGHEMYTCNAPLRVSTEMRLRMLRQPVLVPLLVAKVLTCWARLLRSSWRLPAPDAVVVGHLGQFDVLLARLRWPRATIVLDLPVLAVGVAQDHGIRGRLRHAVLRAIDRVAISAADIVLVDTEEHLDLLPGVRGRAGLVITNGASEAYYRTTPCTDAGPLRFVFCGSYIPLHGATVLARGISLLDPEVDVRFTMIGLGPERALAEATIGQDDRVRWVDWLSREALAAEMAQHHLCLGIFGDTDKAARVLPTKLLLGAAAGCAVVTGESPPQARVFGSAAFTVPRGEPRALTDLIVELARRPDRVASARRRTRALAQNHTPYMTVAALHDLLSEHRREACTSRRSSPHGHSSARTAAGSPPALRHSGP
jgi:glycosyltransferase involved in cell wall biosynthesis